MKVSGDADALKALLEGKRVVEWTYLEDNALALSESSVEYRSLMQTKGKEEIEKRKRFLLGSLNGSSIA